MDYTGAIMKIIEVKGIPDFSQIIDLINAEWPMEYGKADDAEKIRKMLESHNLETDTTKYLIEEEKIIGFYRYSLWPREEPSTKTAHSYDISVSPDFQKKGLGTLLMKDMIEDCRKKGLEKLLSRSFKTNQASIKLHEATGFSLHLETEDSLVWEIDIT